MLRHAEVMFTNGAKWGTDSRAEQRRYAELSWQRKSISPGGKSELFASLLQFTSASVRKFSSADKSCQGNEAQKCVCGSKHPLMNASFRTGMDRRDLPAMAAHCRQRGGKAVWEWRLE